MDSAAAAYQSSKEVTKSVAQKILEVLARMYPEARCGLKFQSAFQLLVATILSAQTTDEAVNKITPSLFVRYPDPQKLASAKSGILESMLHPLGLSRVKSKNIKESAAKLVSDHGSNVPDSMEALLELRGVGRKTAWVVLGECFDTPGLVVDTHMARVAKRLEFTASNKPKKIESDLNRWIRIGLRTVFSHQIITHGRTLCMARNPQCGVCSLAVHCKYFQANKQA